MNALNNWLKENHEDIYDEYLKTLTNIERERESYSSNTVYL